MSCGGVLTPCACAGLIGWVPNTDTLHALIREYRDARKIPLNVEHRLMLGMAPDYENLTVIQKVEVFEHALESTSGKQALTLLKATTAAIRSILGSDASFTPGPTPAEMLVPCAGLLAEVAQG